MLILKWRIARGSNSSRESGRGFVSTAESTLLIRCTRSTKRSFITQLPKNGSLEGSFSKNKMYSEEVDAEDDEIIRDSLNAQGTYN